MTNQPEVSRGNLEVEELNAMHEILYQELGIDLVMACPHDSLDECACRKPLPGMLVEASKTLEIRLDKSWLIGDRWKDIAAGEATGCQTIFLDRGYDEEKPVSQNFTRSTLKDAVDTVLRNFSLPNEEF